VKKDLTSFPAFVRSVSWFFSLRVSELVTSSRLLQVAKGSWNVIDNVIDRNVVDSFAGPEEAWAAGAYALYRRACRRNDVEPAGYESLLDED
jgi:hypothetical protein